MQDNHFLKLTMVYQVVRLLDVDQRHTQVTLHPGRVPLWARSIKTVRFQMFIRRFEQARREPLIQSI